MNRLDKVLDRLNKVNGTEKVILGAQQFRGKDSSGKSTRFVDAIKHEFKSPIYTTRWSDIIELKWLLLNRASQTYSATILSHFWCKKGRCFICITSIECVIRTKHPLLLRFGLCSNEFLAIRHK